MGAWPAGEARTGIVARPQVPVPRRPLADGSGDQQRTDSDGGGYPLQTRTVESALKDLAEAGLADGLNRGQGGPVATWWQTDGTD